MPKKTTEKQKKEIGEAFKKGSSIEDIAIKYGLKNLTIIKYLKNLLGETEFKNLNIYKIRKNSKENNEKNISYSSTNNLSTQKEFISNKKKSVQEKNIKESIFSSNEDFFEIRPLNELVDFEQRKDFTSKPLKDFKIPENIYMVIDKNIELEELFIRDFPEYSFLSEVDQSRKIIKLFSDKKSANSFCRKNQKIIKVPNGKVFSMVSSYLLNKGISRILYDDYLLSI